LVGYSVYNDGGTVVLTADLGYPQQITAFRALTLSQTSWGIYHPTGLSIAVSNDGVSFSTLGYPLRPSPDTPDFSVGWSELDVNTSARYVRYTFTHHDWLFVSELEILGIPSTPPPQSVSVSISPATVAPLYAGQQQQFQATVTGSSNTAVTWTVVQGSAYGSISSSGLYTAPSSVSQTITVGIQATSLADPTKSATVSFAVQPNTISQQMVGPVTPNSGRGRSQLFSFNATPLAGNLLWARMLINSSINEPNSCLVHFDQNSYQIFLAADNSMNNYDIWAGSALLGTPGILSNSQCSIDAANSSVQLNGGGFRVNLSITFNPAWYGTSQYIFMAAEDAGANKVQWPYLGSWNIP
jgi:hypothetical protein